MGLWCVVMLCLGPWCVELWCVGMWFVRRRGMGLGGVGLWCVVVYHPSPSATMGGGQKLKC